MGRVALAQPSVLRRAAPLALAALLACSSLPEGGTVHVVRPGENLYRIGRHYGVSVDDVVRANRIRDVRSVAVGQQLRIPGAQRQQPSASLTPTTANARVRPSTPTTRVPPPRGDRASALREADLRFAWPVSGRINSKFGWRGKRRHEGIDIKADKGTPVRSSEAGRVIYSGKLEDYGRVVIVKHAGRYSTVYAHNHRNRVEKGQFVEKGDLIAQVGKTGNASGYHLHFELRRDRVAQDPVRFLPEPSRTASR
jgi:lipoprotein NlpD